MNREFLDMSGQDSRKLGTGIGNSKFYVPNPDHEESKEVKRDRDRETYSLQEPVISSEKVTYSKPVEVASSPTGVMIVDLTYSLQLTEGSRDRFASISSQDVNSLQRRMVSSVVASAVRASLSYRYRVY